MPFKLQKARDGYFVVDDTGKKYSKHAMPYESALRQMRALYVHVKH
jgi:hypothetical protein